DSGRSRLVAIVSRTLADRHWPGSSAVGRHIRIILAAPSPPIEIVGVVNDVKQFDLDAMSTADLYVPVPQMPEGQAGALAARMYWVVRTEGDPRSSSEAIRQATRSLDPDVATSTLRTLEDVLNAALAPRRANLKLLELFGQIAIVLCAIGVYAVAAFSA